MEKERKTLPFKTRSSFTGIDRTSPSLAKTERSREAFILASNLLQSNTETNLSSGTEPRMLSEKKEESFSPSFDNTGEDPLSSGEGILTKEEGTASLCFFLVELVSRVKKTLASIKAYSGLSKGRFKDDQFGEYFNRKMSEEVEKLNSVLEGLLEYMKVNTPVPKANTIHNILGEVLRSEKKKLEEKKLRIFRKLEKDLPETTLHNEQIRYVVHSILQYALPVIPAGGSLGFLTRTVTVPHERMEESAFPRKTEKFIEILILFSGCKKPEEPAEVALGIPGIPKDDVGDLLLRLVREIIQKNWGQMRLERREKESRTLIVLRLPTERRKVFYYQSARA